MKYILNIIKNKILRCSNISNIDPIYINKNVIRLAIKTNAPYYLTDYDIRFLTNLVRNYIITSSSDSQYLWKVVHSYYNTDGLIFSVKSENYLVCLQEQNPVIKTINIVIMNDNKDIKLDNNTYLLIDIVNITNIN